MMDLSKINFVEGKFLYESRNRFICKVLVENKIYECYVPSSCRLESLINLKNKRVLLTKNKGKVTRTEYSLFAVFYRNKLIILNLNMVNSLVELSIKEGQYETCLENNTIVREALINDYKADLLIKGSDTVIIENKAIINTKKEALFPTIYSERAINQLKKLNCLIANGYKVNYNFISLSPFVRLVKINKEQGAYYENFIRCVNNNMQVFGYCFYFEDDILKSKRIEVLY